MNKYYTILVVFYFATFLAGCNTNISSTTIDNVKMCSSIAGQQCQSDNPNFSPSTNEVYISCALKNSVKNTSVDFSWYYNGKHRMLITSTQVNPGTQSSTYFIHSSLTRPGNGWPIGEYEVKISIIGSNKEPLIKKFTVQ